MTVCEQTQHMHFQQKGNQTQSKLEQHPVNTCEKLLQHTTCNARKFLDSMSWDILRTPLEETPLEETPLAPNDTIGPRASVERRVWHH